jgi:hypothetical protein
LAPYTDLHLLLPGHELQGLINYFNCNIEGLTVPLGSSLSLSLSLHSTPLHCAAVEAVALTDRNAGSGVVDGQPTRTLVALIDYRGFRLVAISLLPISKETIIYGCANGAAASAIPRVVPSCLTDKHAACIFSR